MAYTETEAIYVIHSIPKFPVNEKDGSVMLDVLIGETYYGQNWMCIELKREDLFNIAGLLTIARPQLIHSRVHISNANITHMLQNTTAFSFKEATYSVPVGDEVFTYLVKSGSAGIDIFEDFIAPHFESGFRTQTWGRPYMDDYCNKTWIVENIQGLRVEDYSWHAHFDHSKWGIAIDKEITCYGDNNRMIPQRTRGGGYLCTTNRRFYEAQTELITHVNMCNSTQIAS